MEKSAAATEYFNRENYGMQTCVELSKTQSTSDAEDCYNLNLANKCNQYDTQKI